MSLFHRLLVGGLMTLGLIISGGVAVSAVWQEPVGAPPGNNVLAPLNRATQFGSSTAAFPLVGTFQAPNSINFSLTACPNGQTYLSNGTTWACGAAGGNQNLLQVLNNGADAGAFSGSIIIGSNSGGTTFSVLTNQGAAISAINADSSGYLAFGGLVGVLGSGTNGILGISSSINGKAVYGLAAGFPTDAWSGYFEGGRGVFINSKIQFPNRAKAVNDGANYILTSNDNADLAVMAQDNLYLVFDEEDDIVGGDLIITKDAPNANNPLLVVKNNGNVGIGTTNPSRRLDVVAQTGSQIALSSAPSSGQGSWDGIVIRQNGAEKWYSGVKGNDASADYVIRRNGSVNDVIVQSSTGNVGIGDATPNALLTVGDNDRFQVDGAGNVSLDNQAQLRLLEADANGANYIGFRAPWALSSHIVYTLPSTQGGPGTYLMNNGYGDLSWGNPGSAATAYTAGTNIAIASNAISVIPNPTFAGVVTASSNLIVNGQELNHEALSDFFINSYGGLQLRINRWGGSADFGINNNANTRLLTVTNSGNVGIGTNNPTFTGLTGQHLTVRDTTTNPVRLVLFNNSNAIPSGGFAGQLLFYAGGGNGNRVSNITSMLTNTNENSADLLFLTMNNGAESEKMRITAGGNVGIGTNNPQTKLDVRYTGNGAGLNVIGTGAGQVYVGTEASGSAGAPAQIMFGAYNASPLPTHWNVGTWSDGQRKFYVHDYLAPYSPNPLGQGQTRLVIDSNGSVGIGHSRGNTIGGDNPLNQNGSPKDLDVRFEIVDNQEPGAAGRPVVARITDTGQNPELQLKYGIGANDHWGMYTDQLGGPSAVDDDSFKIWGGGSNRLTVLRNGNVGVGIESPGAQLHVNSTIFVQNQTGVSSQLILEAGSKDWTILAVNPTSGTLPGSLVFSGGGGVNGGVLSITPNNNVGIGYFAANSAVSEKLAVQGNGVFFGSVRAHGTVIDERLVSGLIASGPSARLILGTTRGVGNDWATDPSWVVDNYTGGSSFTDLFRIYPQNTINTLSTDWQDYFMITRDTKRVGIGTGSPTEKLDINSNSMRLRTPRTIPTRTTTCDMGEISWDVNYMYICVSTNNWKRSPLSTW